MSKFGVIATTWQPEVSSSATMTTKSRPSRLRAEINELAAAMHASGTLDTAAFEKIMLRDVDSNEAVGAAPMTGEDIRPHASRPT